MKMNQKNILTSFSKEPVKMFNVDKEQMGVTQQFQQFQKRIKQMKRTILNKIEKFEHRYLKDDFEMDQTRSVEILKEQRNLRDRFSNLENEVNTLNLFISDEWGHESEEELTKMIEKNLTDTLTYWSKIFIVINKGYDIIESSQHTHENLTSTLTGKKTNNKFNLIKLNNNTNSTKVNTAEEQDSTNINIAEEQDEIEQLREAKKETKILKDKLKMYE